MKKCYLDTNLLLYYSDSESSFYDQASVTISQLINQGWRLFVSSLTLDEYFHNMIRFSRVSRQEAFKDLKRSFKRITKLPNLDLVNPATRLVQQSKVISLMIKYQLKSRDAYHLFTMKENKIKYMATFDHDFDKIFEEGRIKKFDYQLKIK